MIRLIATDIDGTLVEEGSSSLPEELFSIIHRLCDHGIIFAAASGRQYRGMERLFRPVSDKILFISENGSNVMAQGEALYASVIDPAIVKEMQAYVRENLPNCHLTLSTTGAMYSTGEQDEPYRRLMVEGYHNDMIFADEIDTDTIQVIKISIYCESGIAPYAAAIEDAWKDRLNVVVAGKPWIDFINPGTDKGAALQRLQKQFGVAAEETMAFGDNHNDIGMIKAAGESYAVETARTAVKEAAKYIAGGYQEMGVLKILEELLTKLDKEKGGK